MLEVGHIPPEYHRHTHFITSIRLPTLSYFLNVLNRMGIASILSYDYLTTLRVNLTILNNIKKNLQRGLPLEIFLDENQLEYDAVIIIFIVPHALIFYTLFIDKWAEH